MKSIFTAAAALLCVGLYGFEYTVESGDYRVVIDSELRHTIRQFSFRGYPIGTRSGYYGTIVMNKPGGYIGAGHTEGGSEKLLAVSLTADGKKVEPAAGKTIRGDRVVLEKVSQFDHALFRVRLVFSPEGVVEQKRFIALEDQPFNAFYSHQYCWDKATTHWFSLTAQGKNEQGEFKHDAVRWHGNTAVRWIANYNADKKLGMMMYYPRVIPGAIRKSTFWEVPRSYNKYYMMTAVPKIAVKGFQSPEYTVVLRGFSAPDAARCPGELNRAAEAAAKIPVGELAEPAL